MAEDVGPEGAAPAGADPAPGRWDSTPLGPRASWPQPLRTLVDLMMGSAQPMFIGWGAEHYLLYNQAYVPLLGRLHPAAFGRPFLEVWHDLAANVQPVVDRLLAGEALQVQDIIVPIRRGGHREEAHFAFSCTPVRTDGERVGGFFCAFIETTAVVAAERLRSEGFRRVEHLFEQAPGFIAVLDGPDHVFTLANATFRRLVGEDRQLIGRSFREALPEATEQGFADRLDHVFATGEPFQERGARVELGRGPGGEMEERIVDFIYQPIYTTDRVITGLFGEGIDVTARHRAEEKLRELNQTLEQRIAEELAGRLRSEEALRQSQKMEAIGQLTGGVAHDFNNLLTVIRSSADVLRRLDLDEPRRRRYLDAIAETADRAARLTAQLLAFARRQALRPSVLNVVERIHAVAEMLSTVVGARVDLVTDLECETCFVEADGTQFETALVNLAVNARDAMEGEGRITIAVRPVDGIPHEPSPPLGGEGWERGDSTSANKQPFVSISLADTGAGMTPEMIEHIFEPFFTTKEVGKGTGLGLSQVYGFAKQSGGEVAVESRPGEGAIFTLYLPRVDPPERQPRLADRPAEAGQAQGHILIVEDNEQVGSFSSDLLADLGYRTSRAVNADEALRMLEQQGPGHFSVVFSDVVMPGMNGVQLAQEIRRRWPDLPVVLTTGYSQTLATEGSHGFELLGKPWSLEDLTRVLRDASISASP